MLSRIIIIYLIVVLVYFKLHGVKNNKIEKFIFSLFIPLFGLVVTVLSEMPKKEHDKKIKGNTNTQKNKIERSKEFLTYIQGSILDNLSIEDYEKTREIILSMQTLPLKKQCKICQIAIWSKNIEISHISAVCLMRIKTYFEKFFVHMESYTDLNKVENIEKYINGLNNYLQCKIVYGSLKENYNHKLISLLQQLIEKKNDCEEKYYHMLIDRCLQMKQYDEATAYSNILLKKYGYNEEICKLILKICYETKNKQLFKETIDNLKNISNLTKESKKIVEFWGGEKI